MPGNAANWTSHDRADVAARIGQICRSEGYFFVHGHGIPAELIKEVYSETKRFYALPLDEKNKYEAVEGSQFLGYRALGRERSRIHGGTEACEQYRIGNTTGDLALTQPVNFYHEHFPTSMELFHQLTALGDGILAACALDLGLGESFFEKYMGTPLHRLGLNYYGANHLSEVDSPVDYAMSPHIDLSLLTVLHQDQSGLEVRDSRGTWSQVPTIPDALFVFLADYVQRWSNGLHRAAPHRVRGVRSSRMSIQYKHRPDYGVVVAPLEALTGPAGPPKFPPLNTGSDYVSVLRSILGR
nr:isopenicillin N synthase family oxygenase [Streptomyces sp. SID8354]